MAAADDTDHDYLAPAPETADPLAVRIKDAAHRFVGGANPEMHFAGPTTTDDPDESKLQRERDSDSFAAIVTGLEGIGTTMRDSLTSAACQPGSEGLSIKAGTVATILVVVQGTVGVCQPAANTGLGNPRQMGIANIGAELTIPPAAGITLSPLPGACLTQPDGSVHCVAITDDRGEAMITVIGTTVGSYSITAEVYHLLPTGVGLGSLLGRTVIPVTVTP